MSKSFDSECIFTDLGEEFDSVLGEVANSFCECDKEFVHPLDVWDTKGSGLEDIFYASVNDYVENIDFVVV